MIRELAIEIYLLLAKVLFVLFKWLPIQNKITFLVSFKENPLAIYNEIKSKHSSQKMVFFCKNGCYKYIKSKVDAPVYTIETGNLWHFILSIYHMATSKIVIVDNYYGLLASANFKKETECIQIWHATGAIKTFGLKDESTAFRTKRANDRFQKVYRHFDTVLAGSKRFAEIFSDAFGLPEDRMLHIGFPRTDFFFNEEEIKRAKERFFNAHPEFLGKKIILYAPTYRETENETLHLELDKMYERLMGEYVLFIRLHPAVKKDAEINYKNFAYDFSDYPDIEDLLVVSDYLISDYSSIPFEYAILEKPMIFYPYDLKEYEEERGFWEPYEKTVPGPVVYCTAELVDVLLQGEFDRQKIREFSQRWNQFTPGTSCQNFVKYLSLSDWDRTEAGKTDVPMGQDMPL